MIKSTKVSIKFANKNKLDNISIFLNEYRRVSSIIVDKIWELEQLPKFISKDLTNNIDTWLSARALQCCGKQTIGIVKGTKAKQSKRIYQYNKFLELGQPRKAKKLKSIIDKVNISKPDVNNIIPELDSRFVSFDFNNFTSFDCIVTISSIGNKLKIIIPIKKTKHFNKLSLNGILKQGIRLSDNNITFMFDIEDKKLKQSGDILGLDIGICNSFSLSNGTSSSPCNHGHTLGTIQSKLSRKQKGSKAFVKAQAHRTNYINWSINQIDFNNIKQLNIEDIKNLRYKNKFSRFLSHWTYTTIIDKLESKCEDAGVQIKRINPTYTSQRCSQCGWVRKTNRKGKLFKCTSCGFTYDADLNAAINISLNLNAISKKERLLHKNKTDFYWNVIS